MELRQTDNALLAIDDLVDALGGQNDENSIFAAVSQALTSRGICNAIGVALANDDHTSMVVHEMRSGDNNGMRPESEDYPVTELSFAGSVPGRVTETATPEFWDTFNPPDLSTVGDDWAPTNLAIFEAGMQSGRTVPLPGSTGPLGAITFMSASPTRFDEQSEAAFSRVADIVAMAIEKSRLIRQLESQITIVAANNERLAASNQDLEDFAYVASHDLQEPLRKIRAFSDRLETKAADRLSDQDREYLDRIQSAAKRMNVLISDLLDFSRVNTRGHDIVSVDTESVVAQVVDSQQAVIEANSAVVDVGSLPNLWADPSQLHQVLAALVENALKFRDPEVSPHVQINVVVDDADQQSIVVADNGMGFDPKYLDRIFKPFQRLHSREDFGGSGIGLAVCRRVMERHEGSITATSTPGSGSRFVLTFPNRTNAVVSDANANQLGAPA